MQVQQSLTPAPTAPSRQLAARDNAAAVDFQSFLRLLTAQLRNQDPLSPLDSTQFVAQLASFSTVEQLVSANARLDQLADEIVGSDLDQFVAWIGHVAEVVDAPVRFNGEPSPFRIVPQADAEEVNLVVRGSRGAEVFRTPITNSDAVQQWKGEGAGTGELYFLEAEYVFADGRVTTGSVSTFDAIEGVRTTESGAAFALSSGLVAPRAAIIGLGR